MQETHWTHEQATRLHTLIPVAIILPVGYEVITHQTILPRQILAAQVQLKGAKIRIISVYLHPDNVQDNLQILIKYLNTIDLRDWTILAGDFNKTDEQCSNLWHQLTQEYGLTDSHPTLPTFRTALGESYLDRILLPTAFLQNLHLRHSTCARWVGANLRHGLVTIKLKHKPLCLQILNYPSTIPFLSQLRSACRLSSHSIGVGTNGCCSQRTWFLNAGVCVCVVSRRLPPMGGAPHVRCKVLSSGSGLVSETAQLGVAPSNSWSSLGGLCGWETGSPGSGETRDVPAVPFRCPCNSCLC